MSNAGVSKIGATTNLDLDEGVLRTTSASPGFDVEIGDITIDRPGMKVPQRS